MTVCIWMVHCTQLTIYIHIPFDTFKLNERRNETTVAFLGRLIPLSNFFSSPFVVDQTEVFSCVEQYFQYNKAILADDENAAAAIMCTSDPLETKRIGDAIYMNQETNKSWRSTNKKIMTEALTHKFQQSTQARKALLETKELNIVEASYDRFWGCGKPLRDSDSLNEAKWTGKNMMESLLKSVRKYLTDS